MKSALIPLPWLPFVFAVLAPLIADATEPLRNAEPLWRLAIANVKKSESLTASRVVTQITALDGKETFLGSIESVDVVNWSQKSAVWVNVSKKTTGSPGFTMELNLHFEDAPGSILDDYDNWTAKGEAPIDGESTAVWEGAKAGKETNTALVYIDPRTALPKRVDFNLPIHSNFGTRSVQVTVIFGSDPKGAWVPIKAVIDQAGRFMFWKRHLIITKLFQDWTERPAL